MARVLPFGSFRPFGGAVRYEGLAGCDSVDAAYTTAHTVTSNANIFDSGKMDIGARYQVRFTQAGTFQYYCTLHPKMTGEVVVS